MSYKWRYQDFAPGGDGVRVYEIRQKSEKLLYKNKKLTLSQLKQL